MIKNNTFINLLEEMLISIAKLISIADRLYHIEEKGNKEIAKARQTLTEDMLKVKALIKKEKNK